MAKHIDEEHIDDEQSKEEGEEDDISEKEKKIFINYVDSFQGKNIARVSSWNEFIK